MRSKTNNYDYYTILAKFIYCSLILKTYRFDDLTGVELAEIASSIFLATEVAADLKVFNPLKSNSFDFFEPLKYKKILESIKIQETYL